MNPTSQSAENARPGPDALLPFVHGLGAVLQQEHALLASLQRNPPLTSGAHAADLARIVTGQRTRVTETVLLLEARCRMFPQPTRFAGTPFDLPAGEDAHEPAPDGDDALAQLVDRHTTLARELGALDELRSGWDPATPLLREAARNHEEMAWMLLALIHENATAGDWSGPTNPPDVPTRVTPPEADWENEGGTWLARTSNETKGVFPNHGPH
jgi:hypothetical protein